MSNNSRKKLAAQQFNKLREERVKVEKDRIENPDKYKPITKSITKNTMAIWAIFNAMAIRYRR